MNTLWSWKLNMNVKAANIILKVIERKRIGMRLASNIANFFQKRFADETITIDRWLLVIRVYIYFDAAQARTGGCSRLKEGIDEGRSLIVYRY